MSVEIAPLTLRDASWIAYRLSPADYAEIGASMMGGYDPVATARACAQVSPDTSFVARWRDTPVAMFGAAAQGSTTVTAWMMGTRKSWRAVPQITRFIRGPLADHLKQQGFVWAEARSQVGHDVAHRWLTRLHAYVVAELPGYGSDGSDFYLFRARL